MKNRLNRIEYASRLLPTYLVFYFAIYFIGSDIINAFDPSKWELGFFIGMGLMYTKLFFVILAVYVLFLLPLNIIFVIKRLHDLNVNGWWSVLALIPIVGQLLSIALIVPEGTKGENKYGA